MSKVVPEEFATSLSRYVRFSMPHDINNIDVPPTELIIKIPVGYRIVRSGGDPDDFSDAPKPRPGDCFFNCKKHIWEPCNLKDDLWNYWLVVRPITIH